VFKLFGTWCNPGPGAQTNTRRSRLHIVCWLFAHIRLWLHTHVQCMFVNKPNLWMAMMMLPVHALVDIDKNIARHENVTACVESQVRVVEGAEERSTSRGYLSQRTSRGYPRHSKGMYLGWQGTRILVGFWWVSVRQEASMHAVGAMAYVIVWSL